jgi:hypothetical protein
MISSLIILSILYILFRYVVAWIVYYNNTDQRFENSIWRFSYDYPVLGERDISDLDDKKFVRKRRNRNRIITIMYFIVLLAFIQSISFVSDLLIFILT